MAHITSPQVFLNPSTAPGHFWMRVNTFYSEAKTIGEGLLESKLLSNVRKYLCASPMTYGAKDEQVDCEDDPS